MKNPKNNTKSTDSDLNLRTLASLVISLIIISVFPLYIAIVVGLWLGPIVIVIDCLYLLIVASFVSVFTGWYRPRWLTLTLNSLGAINFIVLWFLCAALNSFRPSM